LSVYIDTSFLVSLYTPDANSAAAARTMEGSSGDWIISILGELEFVNAIELRVFRKEISRAEAQSSLKEFERDLQNSTLDLRGLPDQVFELARRMARQTTAKLGTRTADLLHVVAAVELAVDYLYTFDRQQRKLAQTLQLKLN
jgi:predicted nucleic acid-binding protein